jgi:hypothetical protein
VSSAPSKSTRRHHLCGTAGGVKQWSLTSLREKLVKIGAKGAGEAGTAGAPGAVMNAINDALRPLGAKLLSEMPFTPERILRALGRV